MQFDPVSCKEWSLGRTVLLGFNCSASSKEQSICTCATSVPEATGRRCRPDSPGRISQTILQLPYQHNVDQRSIRTQSGYCSCKDFRLAQAAGLCDRSLVSIAASVSK